MEEKSGKHILIVGSNAAGYSVAKKLFNTQGVEKIYLTSENEMAKEFATLVDIRPDNVEELLEFVLENAIDFSVVADENAIKKDISTLFQQNSQMIFAPSLQSAGICLSKSSGKKFMYKNRILCPKFAIFDKPSMAVEYVDKKAPIVVKTDEHQGRRGVLVCNSSSIAKSHIEALFESGEKRVIIEDYVLGHEFSFYVITDGYHALPLGSVANYKYALEGNGGILTSGLGSFVPDYKVTKQMEQKILQQVIYPTLSSLARHHSPYEGILGIDCVLTSSGQIFVLEFNSFFQEPDCQSVLMTLNENLYDMMHACVVGSFADDYHNIDIEDTYAVSGVIYSNKKEPLVNQPLVINGIDYLDEETDVVFMNVKKNQYLEYETTGDKALILTRKAKTLARAVDYLYDEISTIEFDGMKYRKDIGK